MHAKIIPIGTSKELDTQVSIDKYNFDNIVDIDDMGSGLLIRAIKKPRK